jgi:hypothetical protein
MLRETLARIGPLGGLNDERAGDLPGRMGYASS